MRAALFSLAVAFLAVPALSQPALLTIPAPISESGGRFGTAITAVDDLDGDDLQDLLVGAPGEAGPPGSDFGPGRAFVVSSATGAILLTLDDPSPSHIGTFGDVVARLDDLDKDGTSDYVVGAPTKPSAGGLEVAGATYVFSGAQGRLLYALVSPNAQTFGYFGVSVADAGDVNRDAATDVLVGAFTETPEQGEIRAGQVHLFSGQFGELLATFVSPNQQKDGHFGRAVCGLGDVDGDGIPDFGVGAAREDHDAPWYAGAAYIISGATGQALHELRSPNAESLGYFGFYVAAAGDLDLDSVTDLAVSAPHESVNAPQNGGRVYTFSGATGELLHQLESPEGEYAEFFGLTLASAGDTNGDGHSDLVVGAPHDGTAPSPNTDGRAYVFSGSDGTLLADFISPFPQNRGLFGSGVASLGDIDGDGLADIAVGASHEALPGTETASGRAYVLSPASVTSTAVSSSPPAWSPLRLAPNPANHAVRLSFELTKAGDVRLAIHDLLGRELVVLADGPRVAGEHTVTVDASRWTPGTYLVRLATVAGVRTTRLTVAR